MRRTFIAFASIVALAGCQPAEQAAPVSASVTGTAAAAAVQSSEQFVGTWTGTTAAGGDIRIVVPAGGTPTYVFRGSDVPVTAARVSGDSLVLRVGRSGGGTVTLTPLAGDQLQYDYSFGGDRATAVVTRS